MNKEQKLKLIEAMEREQDKNAKKIDKLEMQLEELKEGQGQLNHTLRGLKSKVKNDQEELW